MKINSVLVGILISACIIFVGYAVVSLLFETMVDLGWMDEAGSQADKRQRTIWLLSVCLNIVAIQFFNKRKFRNTQKGIAVFTVLAAFGWVFYYYKSLFFVE